MSNKETVFVYHFWKQKYITNKKTGERKAAKPKHETTFYKTLEEACNVLKQQADWIVDRYDQATNQGTNYGYKCAVYAKDSRVLVKCEDGKIAEVTHIMSDVASQYAVLDGRTTKRVVTYDNLEDAEAAVRKYPRLRISKVIERGTK